MGGQFAPEAMDEDGYDRKRHWHGVQGLVRHFWHQWLKEWIPSLTSPRKKWCKLKKDQNFALMITPVDNGHWDKC